MSDVSEKKAWNHEMHASVFDYMHKRPGFILKKHYESFNEGRLLKQFASQIKGKRFFEIGCATGELYRYLDQYLPKFEYTGFDISAPAISRAKSKYPEANFYQLFSLSPESIEEEHGRSDVIWCRDVILHQSEPYDFMDSLIDLANEALFLRLRTRDKGATETNPEVSCQLHWDKHWIPYMILNTDELISKIRNHQHVKKLVISRNYEPLGGQNFRFLPKELFFTSTLTAETALYIQKSRVTDADMEIEYNDRIDSPDFNLFEKIICKLTSVKY